ncbi:50S ribosomal protein L36 [Roseobacter sp. CCS2]|nr:50S ribosomal protein L36 [Roseobacter sp. CCS2]
MLRLALTGLEPALRLVDHIDAALTAHDAAIAVALLERAEGVTYLHGRFLSVAARGLRLGVAVQALRPGEFMVDDTGIEPVTPSMSTKCSTAELIIHVICVSPSSHNEIGRGANRVSRAVYKRSRQRDQGLLVFSQNALSIGTKGRTTC